MKLLKSGPGNWSTMEGARCSTGDLKVIIITKLMSTHHTHTIYYNLDMDIVARFQHHFGSILTYYFPIWKHYSDIAISPTSKLQIGSFTNLHNNGQGM